jgi:hypothetical protein
MIWAPFAVGAVCAGLVFFSLLYWRNRDISAASLPTKSARFATKRITRHDGTPEDYNKEMFAFIGNTDGLISDEKDASGSIWLAIKERDQTVIECVIVVRRKIDLGNDAADAAEACMERVTKADWQSVLIGIHDRLKAGAS